MITAIHRNGLNRVTLSTPKKNLSAFAAWLAQARKRRGWSQDRLAEASGITQEFISALENDRRNASQDVVREIAKALEIDPEPGLRASVGLNVPQNHSDDKADIYYDPLKGFVIRDLPEDIANIEIPERPEDWPPELVAAMHYTQELDPDARRAVYGLWLLQARAHAMIARQLQTQRAALNEGKAEYEAKAFPSAKEDDYGTK